MNFFWGGHYFELVMNSMKVVIVIRIYRIRLRSAMVGL